MSEETKTAFLKYFHQGLTPAAAKIYHETCLIASASEEEDVTKMLADGHINPLDRSIYYLYDMWRCVVFISTIGDLNNNTFSDPIILVTAQRKA